MCLIVVNDVFMGSQLEFKDYHVLPGISAMQTTMEYFIFNIYCWFYTSLTACIDCFVLYTWVCDRVIIKTWTLLTLYFKNWDLAWL